MVIERGGAGLALVVDASLRMVGTLADGDIRRAILEGWELSSPLAPHVRHNFVSVGAAVGRAEVLDLMQARQIAAIPVLDEEGHILGIHLMREILGAVERPNWAVVMAGGVGSRLRPLTEKLPKPMLKVAGRPILERIVLHLVGHGIRRVYLSVGYLGAVIEEHFGDGSRFGCRIEYLREHGPLGTGGALSLLPDTPTAPLVVMNGDLVTQADVGAMLESHEGASVTVGVRPWLCSIPFGCIEVEDSRITRIEEKPTLARLVNAGVYVLSPSVLARVPAGVDFPITALLESCIAEGETVRAFEVDGEWTDVGQLDQLRLARGAA